MLHKMRGWVKAQVLRINEGFNQTAHIDFLAHCCRLSFGPTPGRSRGLSEEERR